jgi:hypothetical protein
MKRLVLAASIFVLMLSSCGEEETVYQEAPKPKPGNHNVDPNPELKANIDSLRFVYSRPLKNGIYLANRTGHTVITLLPVEAYEKPLGHFENCNLGTGINYVVTDVRRFVHFNEETSLEKTNEGFSLSLSENQMEEATSFQKRFAEKNYVVLLNEHPIKTGAMSELLTDGKINFSTCPDTQEEALMSAMKNFKNTKKDDTELLEELKKKAEEGASTN